MDTSTALKLTGVKQGTYNSWLQSQEFVAIYRQRDALNSEYKQEAIQILRRDNQLEAVLLEGKIIAEMKREIDEKDYNLIRSRLACDVYAKLITDLDVIPHTQLLTWEQRIGQITNIVNPPPVQISPVIEGEFKPIEEEDDKPETDNKQETEHTESELLTDSEQATEQTEEKTEE